MTVAFKDDDYENLYAMHGDTDGYFRPYDSVTTAELVTMLDRVISTAD